MSNLKWRLALIGVLVLASIWALYPRNVKVRQRRADGTFYDTTTYRVPLRKGLDLQGGMHLALEVDDSKGVVADKSEAIDRALKVVRTRIEGLGVSETVIQKAGSDRILVEIPASTTASARSRWSRTRPSSSSRSPTRPTASRRRCRASTPSRRRRASAALRVARRRRDADPERRSAACSRPAGLAEDGAAAKADSAKATARSRTPRARTTGGPISEAHHGRLDARSVRVRAHALRRAQAVLRVARGQQALPPGKVVRFGNDSTVIASKSYRFLYLLDERPIITGEYLTDAKPNQSPLEGTVVEFTLSNEGGRRFQRETAKHVHDYMAIVLDKVVMGAPPIINSAIATRGRSPWGRDAISRRRRISRSCSRRAPARAARGRRGAQHRSRPRSRLDQQRDARGRDRHRPDRRHHARVLPLLGTARRGGLVLYVLYTLAALAGFDAVLTLPGLAGFILSIGIAVDANVLIFERIREELDRGKTVRTSIDDGFRHAMSAIVDSNVTTILTAMVLYQFGTGRGEGLRRHAHRRHHRVHAHVDLRREDVLPPVAQPHARAPRR
jgi:preprotein translocase subunit SecD